MKKLIYVFIVMASLQNFSLMAMEENANQHSWLVACFKNCFDELNHRLLASFNNCFGELKHQKGNIMCKYAEEGDILALQNCIVKFGWDPNEQNQEGHTVESVARVCQKPEVLEFLKSPITSPTSVTHKKMYQKVCLDFDDKKTN